MEALGFQKTFPGDLEDLPSPVRDCPQCLATYLPLCWRRGTTQMSRSFLLVRLMKIRKILKRTSLGYSSGLEADDKIESRGRFHALSNTLAEDISGN